jgi:hypothetical protein
MRTQESLPPEIQSVRDYEKRLLMEIDRFCFLAWQYAPPQFKAWYSCYKLSSEDPRLEAMRAIFSADSLFMTDGLTMIKLILKMPSFTTETELRDPDMAARALANASYTIAMLGGASCAADLVATLDRFEKQHSPIDGEVQPTQLFEAYKLGHKKGLIFFLNDRLRDASEKVRKLEKKENPHYVTDHAHSLCHRSETGKLSYDLDLIYTEYHLYYSLLRLVEPTAGNA